MVVSVCSPNWLFCTRMMLSSSKGGCDAVLLETGPHSNSEYSFQQDDEMYFHWQYQIFGCCFTAASSSRFK